MLVIIGAWVVIRRGSTKTSRSHVPSMRPLDFKVVRGGGGISYNGLYGRLHLKGVPFLSSQYTKC